MCVPFRRSGSKFDFYRELFLPRQTNRLEHPDLGLGVGDLSVHDRPVEVGERHRNDIQKFARIKVLASERESGREIDADDLGIVG